MHPLMQAELVRFQPEDKSRQRLHHSDHHIISSKYPKFKALNKACLQVNALQKICSCFDYLMVT